MKKFFIGFIIFVGILACFAVGYYVFYRFTHQDHIIGYVPNDALAYIHDQKGSAKDYLGTFFPEIDKDYKKGVESGIIVTSDGSVILAWYENKQVHTQKQIPLIHTSFRSQYIKQGFWGLNLAQFPVYGIVSDKAFEWLPSEFQNSMKKNGVLYIVSTFKDGRAEFSFHDKISWGKMPWFAFSHKKHEQDWVPESAEMVLENQNIVTWQQTQSLLVDHTDIIQHIESDFSDLQQTKRVVTTQNDSNPTWAMEWDKTKKPLVEQLIQQLAHEAFPLKEEGTALEDGTKTAEYFAKTNEFPGIPKQEGDIYYTLYKKDEWELVLMDKDESIILSNNIQILSLINKNKPFTWPPCGYEGKAVTWKQKINGKEAVLYITSDISDTKVYGCIKIE